MPVNATVDRTINAPKDIVWDILDDFPTISAWSAGIKQSFTTGDTDKVTGLGAERQCILDDAGKKVLDERISAYRPGESMTIDVWNVQGLPLKSSQATFSVRSTGPNTTVATIEAAAVPKLPNVFVRLLHGLLSNGIAKNFGGLLDELAAAAEQRASQAANS